MIAKTIPGGAFNSITYEPGNFFNFGSYYLNQNMRPGFANNPIMILEDDNKAKVAQYLIRVEEEGKEFDHTVDGAPSYFRKKDKTVVWMGKDYNSNNGCRYQDDNAMIVKKHNKEWAWCPLRPWTFITGHQSIANGTNWYQTVFVAPATGTYFLDGGTRGTNNTKQFAKFIYVPIGYCIIFYAYGGKSDEYYGRSRFYDYTATRDAWADERLLWDTGQALQHGFSHAGIYFVSHNNYGFENSFIVPDALMPEADQQIATQLRTLRGTINGATPWTVERQASFGSGKIEPFTDFNQYGNGQIIG